MDGNQASVPTSSITSCFLGLYADTILFFLLSFTLSLLIRALCCQPLKWSDKGSKHTATSAHSPTNHLHRYVQSVPVSLLMVSGRDRQSLCCLIGLHKASLVGGRGTGREKSKMDIDPHICNTQHC